MIKSAASINKFWLLRNSHFKEFTLNGFFSSRRLKATALNIAEETIDEAKSNDSENQQTNQYQQKQHPHQQQHLDLSSIKSQQEQNHQIQNEYPLNKKNLLQESKDLVKSLAKASESKHSTLPSLSIVPPTALLLSNSEENRLKYGHSGKALQDKIAIERQLRSPSLHNLVFANRKLSFYDTFTSPDHDEFKRYFYRRFSSLSCLRSPCKIMSESMANLLEDFVNSEKSKKTENINKNNNNNNNDNNKNNENSANLKNAKLKEEREENREIRNENNNNQNNDNNNNNDDDDGNRNESNKNNINNSTTTEIRSNENNNLINSTNSSLNVNNDNENNTNKTNNQNVNNNNNNMNHNNNNNSSNNNKNQNKIINNSNTFYPNNNESIGASTSSTNSSTTNHKSMLNTNNSNNNKPCDDSNENVLTKLKKNIRNAELINSYNSSNNINNNNNTNNMNSINNSNNHNNNNNSSTNKNGKILKVDCKEKFYLDSIDTCSEMFEEHHLNESFRQAEFENLTKIKEYQDIEIAPNRKMKNPIYRNYNLDLEYNDNNSSANEIQILYTNGLANGQGQANGNEKNYCLIEGAAFPKVNINTNNNSTSNSNNKTSNNNKIVAASSTFVHNEDLKKDNNQNQGKSSNIVDNSNLNQNNSSQSQNSLNGESLTSSLSLSSSTVTREEIINKPEHFKDAFNGNSNTINTKIATISSLNNTNNKINECEDNEQKSFINMNEANEKVTSSIKVEESAKEAESNCFREDSIIEEDVIREMLAGISRVKQKGTFVKIISQYLSHREQEQKHAEDVLFDMFYNEETGLISMGKFLASLKTTGIRKNDPRIRELMDNLKKVHKLNNYESGSSPETQHLNRETFKAVVAQNIVLIAKAFRQQFVIPDFSGFVKDIEEIYWKCKSNASGKVADYIPQLSRYSPDSWGVSICTIDGQRFSIGDVEVPFTLQSCSKPLTYAIALEKLGADVVHSYIGQEPSGRNFNELVLDYNKKPHNPMINAGAILTCALLQVLIKPELTFAEKFDYTMSWFKRMSGGETIGFNNAVFLSEREAADRNYALGFYMRENKCYPKLTNLKEVMDFYFQCCSMETTCEAMSVVAATLANGGICPTTEEKVFRSEVVRDVLSIMHSCGTYDYSGQFAFKVGLPAKSGVSGGMMLVIPNVMGIFTWSPPLDQLGNPVRGVQFCEELVNAFNFHRFDNLKHASNKKDPRKHRYETKGLSIVNLLFSAASGDVTALRRHRLSGMDLTLADYDGRTALHLAASEGHLECVKFLLEHCRVPYNPKDRWGNMPIDEAQNFGHQTVIDYLTAYAEKNGSNETTAADTETITTTTQADEELKPAEIDAYDRSAAASPIPSESGSFGMKDKTRPGL